MQSTVTELSAELAGANATLRQGSGRGRILARLLRGRRRVGAAIRAGDRAARAGDWAAAGAPLPPGAFQTGNPA